MLKGRGRETVREPLCFQTRHPERKATKMTMLKQLSAEARPGMLFADKTARTDAIKAAREDSRLEARTDCGYRVVRSRGMDLIMADGSDRVGDPEYGWNGSTCSLLVFICAARAAGATEVWASGGHDGADSLFEMNNDRYDPSVGTWDVLLWSADGKPRACAGCEEDAMGSPSSEKPALAIRVTLAPGVAEYAAAREVLRTAEGFAACEDALDAMRALRTQHPNLC